MAAASVLVSPPDAKSSAAVAGSIEPATALPSLADVMRFEFRPSFEIFEATRKAGERIKIKIRTENYDPLHKWMPFIDWDGTFEESSPLSAVFTAPASKRSDVISALKSKGFVHTTPMLIAKF